jgi:hypothetical protein
MFAMLLFSVHFCVFYLKDRITIEQDLSNELKNKNITLSEQLQNDNRKLVETEARRV